MGGWRLPFSPPVKLLEESSSVPGRKFDFTNNNINYIRGDDNARPKRAPTGASTETRQIINPLHHSGHFAGQFLILWICFCFGGGRGGGRGRGKPVMCRRSWARNRTHVTPGTILNLLSHQRMPNPVDMDTLNQGLRTDGEKERSRTRGLRGHGDEEKKQRLGGAAMEKGKKPESPRCQCQRSVSFFWKGPQRKYFSSLWTTGLCCHHSTLPL